jgi:DNA-binding response OmpR family regulator
MVSMMDGGLGALRVLVIDDNAQMRLLVRSMLRAAGIFHCREAKDVDDGLATMRTFGADLVLCDLAMTPKDGLAFARHVRRAPDSPNPFVSIIMMTCHSQLSQVALARDIGVNSFLAKPISARSLIEHILAAINDSRPFVRCDNFFGPDRRRQKLGAYRGPWRRLEDSADEDDAANSLDLDTAFGARPLAARAC